MRQRYPDEMAIILQHEFWDLNVNPDAFEVSLNFSRKPERLTIPFDSITGFSDPSVPFGFKLEPRLPVAAEAAPAVEAKPAPKPAPATKLTPAPRPAAALKAVEKGGEGEAKKDGTKVVSIDSFRKK